MIVFNIAIKRTVFDEVKKVAEPNRLQDDELLIAVKCPERKRSWSESATWSRAESPKKFFALESPLF
jgi:hypothetical protein